MLLCERVIDVLLLFDLAPFLDSSCLKKQSSPLEQVPLEVHKRQSPWVAASFIFVAFAVDALGEASPFSVLLFSRFWRCLCLVASVRWNITMLFSLVYDLGSPL